MMSVKSKKLHRSLFRFLAFISTFSVISFLFLKFTNPVSATWYDDTYAYRLKFTFTHNATISSERAITFTLDTAELIAANLMQGDCDDTRFTDNTGKLLKYELTGTCDNAATTYEVVFPNIVNGTNVGYVYYANPAASSTSTSVSGITALTPSGGDPSDTAPTSTNEQGPGPVMWLPMDEGHDTSTQDGTLNNNDATFAASTAAPTWQSEDMCVSGKCLKFDGSDDYISTSNTSVFDASRAYTIEAWIMPNSCGEGGNSGEILAKVSFLDVYLCEGGGTNNLAIWASATARSADNSITMHTWQHVAVVHNGSGNFTFYVNGKDPGSPDASAGNPNGDAPIVIGSEIAGGSTNNFDGFIDDVKIYPYARTSDQIKTDFTARGVSKGAAATFGSNQTQLNNGLVGYWKMDETLWDGTPGEVIDASGNNNNGVRVGNATTTFGKFSRAGTFDGTDDRITVPSSSSINPTSAISIATWVKTSATSRTDLLQRWYGSEPYQGYGLVIEPGGTGCSTDGIVGIWVGDATNWYLCSSGTVNDNTWHHVVGTYNGSIAQVFIDGKLDSSGVRTGILNNSGFDLTIAADRGNADNLNGQMDEVRIYDRVLSSKEVSDLYNFTPGPVGYWKMDENNGNTANDSSGNNYVGSMSVTPPTWTTGKTGSALNFSNATYLEGSIATPTSVTLSAWIYMTSAPQDSNTGKILALGATGTSYHYLDLLNTSGTITARMVANNSGSAIASSTSIINPNTWYHLEGTYNPDEGYVKLFVNGVQETKTSFSTAMTSTGSFNVGIDLSHASNRAFTGKIDDAKVYDYVRTPKQVIEDMNAGHPVGGSPVGSQLIYWSLDQNTGTTVYNSVPSQSTLAGTLSSGTTILDQCYVNACAITAATTDYISGGDVAALDSASNLSFTLWYSYLDNTTQAVISKWNNSNQDNFLVSIESGTLKVYVTSLATQTVSNSPSFSVSNIDCSSCHLAIVYDGTLSNSDRIKVYKNGIKQTGTISGTIPTNTTATTSNFKVNASDDVTTYTGSLAVFDEVKVYTSSLSDADVLIDMNAGSGASFGGVLGTHDYEGFSGNPPLAWWKFDDNKGTTVADSGGYNHTQNLGASTAAPVWTIGKSGSALKYDGSNDYSATAAAIDLSAESTITVEFWLNWDTYANDDDLALEFTPNINSNNGGFIIDPNFSTSGTFAIWQMNSSGTPSGAHFTRPSAGTWHHYAIILDKSAASALDTIPYVDGAPMAFTKQYTATMDNTFANDSLYFMSRAGSNLFGAGKIDDVRIYNYARTPAQIAYNYNRGNPVLQYNLDECSGLVIHNSSLNSNGTQVSAFNGTLAMGASDQTSAGDCTTNASTAWYTGRNGKYTSSLNFDGTDDVVTTSAGYILAPNTTSLTNVSWGAWFNPSASPTSVGLLILPDHFRLSTNASNYAQCATGTFSNNVIATSALPQSTWTHVMCVYDGTSMKIYLNGILNNTTTGTDNFTSQSASLRIANESPSPGYYAGLIDDVRIYNYPLTLDLVKRVFNEGSAVRFGP